MIFLGSFNFTVYVDMMLCSFFENSNFYSFCSFVFFNRNFELQIVLLDDNTLETNKSSARSPGRIQSPFIFCNLFTETHKLFLDCVYGEMNKGTIRNNEIWSEYAVIIFFKQIQPSVTTFLTKFYWRHKMISFFIRNTFHTYTLFSWVLRFLHGFQILPRIFLTVSIHGVNMKDKFQSISS